MSRVVIDDPPQGKPIPVECPDCGRMPIRNDVSRKLEARLFCERCGWFQDSEFQGF